MSEELSDFFKIVSEDKKKKKEEFNEMVGDLGLDSLFNDIAAEKKRIKEEKEKQLAKKVEEEKKQKEKFDKIVGDMSLDSLFGDLAKVKKESKEEKEKEQKILSSFENFLTNKIDDIEEIKDEVVEDVNVIEEVKPEPEEVKPEPEVPSFVEKSLEILDEVSDPLTPLDQNFATLQDLQDHYRKFLVRIQQQLSSLGGGGIEDAPKTGGPYVRQGQKWVVSSGGGGIGTDGSVNTTGIITASSFSGDGSALTGISGGIGTDGSVNTTGIITASSFSGDGSALTGISTFSGNYDDLTNTPTIPTNNNQLTNGAGYITTSFTSTSQLTNDAGFITNNISGDVTITSTDSGSSAAPEFKLHRNSASPDDGDYLGQIKFAGESDTGVERNYAKITGKISDASNGTEDGIIEIAHIKAGSQNISARFKSTELMLMNGTNFSVDGTSTFQNHVHLGDDDELRFGANNDFKIVHDPNDCRFENSNGDIKFKNTGNYFFFDEDGGETLASFINDGAVNLYYDNSKKFETTDTGIDVTGHTETDTLNVTGVSTFQSNAIFEGKVGIGTDNPTAKLDVKQTNSDTVIGKLRGSASTAYLNIEDSTTTSGNVAVGAAGNDLLLRAGNSNHVRLNFAGNLGIGTFNPTAKLDVRGNSFFSGNITVDGTVDGRDIATDGTKLDGIEASADVTDATNVDAAGAVMNSDTSTSSMSFVVDEDNMASNSATKVPTQQSVKAYVDANSGGGGSSVWTTTGNDIYYTTGQVGIGSTQPTEELDVVGKVNISDDLFISGPDDRAFFVDAGLGRLGVGTKNPTRVLDLVGHGPFTADFQLTQHNSDADAGAFRLRRSRGTAASPTALSTNDGVGALAFYRYDGSGYRKNAAVEADVKDGDSNSGIRLIFQTSEGTTSAENRLVIMPTGEIGIGKDDPDSLLTIQGTSNLQDLLEFRTSANRRLFIKTPATTHTRDAFQIQTENSLEFVIDSDLAMRIDHDANVGIGTTAPTEKFEVYGKAVITDDLFISGPDDRAFFVDAGSGRLGVGTKNPTRVLDLVGHGPATADFQLTQLNDTADGGAFRLRRARGSAGSETALIDNDGVGSLAYYRYDGTDYRKNGAIEAKVEDGDSNLGIKLLFQTNEGTSSGVDRMVILPNGNIGIGKASPSVALDVNGTIEADVLVADGGTYDTGTESKSDAALVMTEDSAIYTLDNSGTRLRRLIEKQSDFIKIGQTNTSLVDGIQLFPGSNGSVVLHHGSTSESTGQKLETIGTGVTVYGDAYVGSDNSAGVVLRSPDGTAYRLIVANDGTLTTTAV